MNIEDEIAGELSKRLQEEIDWEMMASLLVQLGWTPVHLPNFNASGITLDMNNWLHLECKSHWRHHGKTWLFEDQNEAALFKLTWS